jgi:soluble lytic murein transglycosylase-like protein
MQSVINTDQRQRRMVEVAGLLLGIILILVTSGGIAPEGRFNQPQPLTFATVVHATAVEVPREVVAIAEDLVQRFGVKKGVALSISTEIFTAAHSQGIQPSLVLAIVAVESHYKANAVNRQSGAAGLMQVLARFHKKKVTAVGGEKELLQIRPNIQVGSQILAEYLDIEDGNLKTALGRYFGSPEVDAYFSRVRLQMRHFERVIKSLEQQS